MKNAIPSSVIYIIKNDELDISQLISYLAYFSAVIIGPGPGSPAIPSDIGVVKDIWHISNENLIPIFGVCLGLQSLGVEHGAALNRLHVVKHGQVSRLRYIKDSLFEGITKEPLVVRYHSLHVSIQQHSKLAAIAWADDGEENGQIIMALKHTTKPFWAVQYHPESVLTDDSGIRVFHNFWTLACQWSDSKVRLQRSWCNRVQDVFALKSWPALRIIDCPRVDISPQYVICRTVSLPELTVSQICEVLGVYKASTDFVLLDSAALPGSYSIIGCIQPSTLKIQYSVGDRHVNVLQDKQCTSIQLGTSNIWEWLSSFMQSRRYLGSCASVPFWGGLIGYLSYEIGVTSMDPSACLRHTGCKRIPDVNLVYIERSLVIHNGTGDVHIQSLRPDDDTWFSQTISLLKRATYSVDKDASPSNRPKNLVHTDERIAVHHPNKATYIRNIKKAQEFLSSGDSYELCLTAKTRIELPGSSAPSSQTSWELYKRLRSVNPAPYAAYLRLHPTTLVSSSPERFLSYSRTPNQLLQLRPIKGTVRKGKNMTVEEAKRILNSPKEIGENLMIVDLIRHDLHGVVGPNVEVKKFCGIEEYETVWQLVSVIEGAISNTLADGMGTFDANIGWEMLKMGLPPGSMTGAPKKRSVEILKDIEGEERNLYSGVMGYWCVGGGGDWSVTIRSCFKSESDVECTSSCPHSSNANEWFVGAGGAITALSDPEGEWEEMLVKLQSVLRAFGEAGNDSS